MRRYYFWLHPLPILNRLPDSGNISITLTTFDKGDFFIAEAA